MAQVAYNRRMSNNAVTPVPNDDEAAAIMAAMSVYLASSSQELETSEHAASGWQHATKLQIQGLRATRTARPPRWSTIERLRRAQGSFGF